MDLPVASEKFLLAGFPFDHDVDPGAIDLQLLQAPMVMLPDKPSLPVNVSPVAACVLAIVCIILISLLFICCLHCLSQRRTGAGRIAQLSMSEIRILVPGTIMLFLSSAATLLIPYCGGEFIKMLTSEKKTITNEEVSSTMIQVLVVGFLASVFSSIRGFLFTLAGERVINRLRQRIFRSLLRQEMAYFDKETSGQLISRLTNDAGTLQNAATSDISMALRSFASFVMTLIILIITSWKLTLSMLAVVPICSVLASIMGRLSRKNGKHYQEKLGEVSTIAGETLSNMRTVCAFPHGEDLMLRRFCSASESTFQAGRTKAVIYGSWSGIVGMLFYVAFSVVLWYGAFLVQKQELEVGSLVSFILYTINLSASIAMLGSILPRFGGVIGATTKIFEIIEREPELKSGDVDRGASCTGLVEFEEVTFSYPTRPDVKVLDKVSFVAQPNQVVALVGPSGSGKSSCVGLLQRLYDCQGGSVRIDGYDVRELSYKYLRRHIAIVSQEPILFATTIRENIRFGVPDEITDAAMEICAKQANCHDYVVTFPDAYQTMVGERGVQLSGGQKQRVAIARALMANPTILLLDEATSALDAESEGIVQDALNTLMAQRCGRTHIVVAHRLSTIRTADSIVVLKKGVIAEMGTHESLLASEAGIYRDLQRRQLAKDSSDPVLDPIASSDGSP